MAKFTRPPFNNIQRIFIADKLMDSANVALAVLVLGQLVTDKIQSFLIVLGLILYVGAWFVSVQYTRGGGKSI